MERKAIIGVVLMVVGTALFLPGLSVGSGVLFTLALVLATALLTLGTYLVGTSEGGRPV